MLRLSAGRLWGASQMLRQGDSTPLNASQAQVAKRALAAFTMALNRSQQPGAIAKRESIAHLLQQAWQQVKHSCHTIAQS